jgi:hypothetical protein
MLENLYSKDQIIPKDFSSETEEQYFSLLKGKDLGKSITNIAEYLLETDGLKGQSKVKKFFYKFSIESCFLVPPWLKVL